MFFVSGFSILILVGTRKASDWKKFINGEILVSYKTFNKLTFLLVFSVLIFGAAQDASAATRTVTKIADTNDFICNVDCSLREAVAVAASGDTIVFAAGLAGQTITLTQGVVTIDKNLVVNGVDGLKVSGAGASRVFHITAKAIIDNLDLKNGFATHPDVVSSAGGQGGAVLVQGELTLNNSTVSMSSAHSGGAIAVSGVLKLNNAIIINNSASFVGGGIEADSQSTVVEINDSVIKYNHAQRGGGLEMSNGTLKMTGTTVSGNHATSGEGLGGGIFLTGINYFYTSYQTNFDITSSTISGNSARSGGGIFNQGYLTLINTTISGNEATETNGGGLVHNTPMSNFFGELRMLNVTVTQNAAPLGLGGGVYHSGNSGELNVANSIIADNSNLNDTAPDVKGILDSWGYNLFSSLNGMQLLGDWSGIQINANPALAPLANNGGKTKTHLPYLNSPAVDKGSDALAVDEGGSPLVTDQRGKGRFNGTVDLGAVERYNERITQ